MYGIRMMLRGRHPVYGLPFEGDVPNRLQVEWNDASAQERRRRLRKVFQRDLGLLLGGQAGLCVDRAPKAMRKVLWFYNWTTLGDSIMDLSARGSIPAGVEVDLCIAPALVPLYKHEPRFNAVYGSLEECLGDYDFILVHELSTRTLRNKRARWPRVPFAPVLNYTMGEQFARPAFVDARIRHLFSLPEAPAPRPWLSLGAAALGTSGRFEIAIALGARDPRRRFAHWNETLQAILEADRFATEKPRFHLLGSQNERHELETFSADVRQWAVDHVGRTSILEAATLIRECDAFLGADGGLMHLAAALDKPGLALFAEIDPAMRLSPGTRLLPLASRSLAELLAPQVADAFLIALTKEPTNGSQHD